MTQATASRSQAIIDLFDQYVIPNYRRYPVALVRGQGSTVWDADGKSYLDLFPGWGCNILGYSPPGLVRAIQEAVALLETGRTQAAWDLLRAAVPCPPPDYDPPRLPE